MNSEIVQDIRLELNKLAAKNYCVQQNVVADSKQLRHLRVLLDSASGQRKEAVLDFSRCVHDVAASTSRLSQLTLKLYEIVTS